MQADFLCCVSPRSQKKSRRCPSPPRSPSRSPSRRKLSGHELSFDGKVEGDGIDSLAQKKLFPAGVYHLLIEAQATHGDTQWSNTLAESASDEELLRFMLRKGAAAEHTAFLAALRRRARNPMGNPIFGYYSSARVQQLLLHGEGHAEAYRCKGVTAVLCKLTVDAAEPLRLMGDDGGRSVRCRTPEPRGDHAVPPRNFFWVEFIDDETASGYRTGQAWAM